ncbi:MAG: c-type cytochrome biogenesis protein CcmI, partial [Gammaproteobacteria bacterium]|nr:c-type cytochrome biogenesis protein CcmI [Gammaproteobacteria bacterium]
EEANLAIYRQRRDEIRRDEARLGIQAEDSEALEAELGIALIDQGELDVTAREAPDASQARPEKPNVALAIALAATFVVVSIALYRVWGEPDATALLEVGSILQKQPTATELARGVALLNKRTQRLPGDRDSWYYLGYLRMRQSDYKGAATAFAMLHGLGGANAEVDIAWVQARYLASRAVIDDQTRAIMQRVLAREPNHPVMLEMLSTDAFRRGAFEESAAHMERALGQTMPAARREALLRGLGEARSKLDPARPRITVTVKLDDPASAPPWLLVFARAQDGAMPRAIVRRPALAEQTLILDDVVSMNRALPLSESGDVVVVARLTSQGTAASSPLDWETISQPVDAATHPDIELTLTAPSAPETHGIAAEVSLGTGIVIPPATPIFVIARAPDRPGPPLAVRRLTAGALPARVVLTDADAMVAGLGISGHADLEIVARAALGGSPTARAGDIESFVHATRIDGETIVLTIENILEDG